MSKLETKFQANLKSKINKTYGKDKCYIHKTECNDYQGIPDLCVTYRGKAAYLECKRSATASHRPNQDYRVKKINEDGGFARVVYPENEDEVLKEMEEYFNGVE